MLRIMALLMLTTTATAREYMPYVKVLSYDNGASVSGTVIGENRILTCAHILQFIENKKLEVQFVSKDKSILMTIPCEVEKYDHDLDLMVLRVTVPKEIEVPILELGEPEYNIMAQSCGYVSRFIQNNTFVKDSTTYTAKNGTPLIYTKGPCLNGMSGGPLVQNGKIIGVQSTKAPSGGLYVPSSVVRDFLKD